MFFPSPKVPIYKSEQITGLGTIFSPLLTANTGEILSLLATQKLTTKQLSIPLQMITLAYNLVLIVLGTFLGLSLGTFFIFNKSEKNRANLILGIFLIIYTGLFLPPAFHRLELLEYFPHFVHLDQILPITMGQLMFFYTRACTEQDFKFRRIDLLHFIPPVIFFLVWHLPDFLASGQEKIDAYFAMINRHDMRKPPLITVMKALIALGYYTWIIKRVLNYKKHLTNEASFIDKAYQRWLIFYSSVSLAPIFIICIWLLTEPGPASNALILSILFLFVFSVYLMVLLKPALFHTFPHQLSAEQIAEPEKTKYENSNLREDQKEKYLNKLMDFVKKEKPYQEAEITLSTLAEQINIPTHHLSQVINEKLGVSFVEFINGYRVEEAKINLRSDSYEHYTIMAIAYEVGFNSKTAFYSSFKKQTGMTPSAFRKSKELA